MLDIKYGVSRKPADVESLGPGPMPINITVLLRILSHEDDEFIRVHDGPLAIVSI